MVLGVAGLRSFGFLLKVIIAVSRGSSGSGRTACGTTRAGRGSSRTTSASAVPSAACAALDIAHGDRRRRRVGPKPPLVTRPIGLPAASVIAVPSRAGARPSGRMPTRLRAGPSASCAQDRRRRRESRPRRGGACRSPRRDRPRPGSSSRRCRGRRGTARLRAAANRARRARSARPPARRAAPRRPRPRLSAASEISNPSSPV